MAGRPKKLDSRNRQYRIRLNDKEDNMLNYASKLTGQQKSEIFRQALVEYYQKVKVAEHRFAREEVDWQMEDYEMEDYVDEGVSLERAISCPYCEYRNVFDFSDYSESSVEERQMGPEIEHSFEVENHICESCGKEFDIKGSIWEYPMGVYNDEDINVIKHDYDGKDDE